MKQSSKTFYKNKLPAKNKQNRRKDRPKIVFYMRLSLNPEHDQKLLLLKKVVQMAILIALVLVLKVC